jgi:Arc/MetJ family transcription regulator
VHDFYTYAIDLLLTAQVQLMLEDIGMVTTTLKEERAFVCDMVRAISGNCFLAQRICL